MRRITSRTKPFRPDLGSNSLLMPSPRSAGLPRGWLWLRVELLQAGCHYRLKRSPLDPPQRILRRLELLRAAAKTTALASPLRASRAEFRSNQPRRPPLRGRAIRSQLRCAHFPHRRSPGNHATDAARAAVRGRIAGPPTSRNNETFSSVAEAPTRNHRRAADSFSKCPPRHREIAPRGRGRRVGRDRASVRCALARAPGAGGIAPFARRAYAPEPPRAIARSLRTPCRFAMLSEGSAAGDFDAASTSRLAIRAAKALARGKPNGEARFRFWGTRSESRQLSAVAIASYCASSITFAPSGTWNWNSESAGLQVEPLLAELHDDHVSEQVDDSRLAHVPRFRDRRGGTASRRSRVGAEPARARLRSRRTTRPRP